MKPSESTSTEAMRSTDATSTEATSTQATSTEALEPEQTSPTAASRKIGLPIYLLIGVYFGILLTKSEVISWFRIQEMFRFQSFHMYGIIGSAVLVGIISVQIIRRLKARAATREEISIPPKEWGKGYRYWIGGTLFGFGWALLGACPGPIFALIGAGVTVLVVGIVSALAGTWVYAYLRPSLPH